MTRGLKVSSVASQFPMFTDFIPPVILNACSLIDHCNTVLPTKGCNKINMSQRFKNPELRTANALVIITRLVL